MINVLVDQVECELFKAGLRGLLDTCREVTICVDETSNPDVVVASMPVTDLEVPWVAFVLSGEGEVGRIRDALVAGAYGIITEQMTGDCQIQVVRCAAVGITAIPSKHVGSMLKRTFEPPRELTETEVTMLRIAAIESVSAAGVALGFSRRQSQRRYSNLCSELGIGNHREAIVAAARWGLV